MRVPLALALTAALLPAAAHAQQPDFRWSGSLGSGKTIEIRNVNGEIVAERGSGNTVEVTAEKEAGRRGDPDDVEIRRVESADGVTICAVFPTPRGADEENECRPGGGHMNTRNNDTQVHFRVRVPAGVRLVAATVNGGVRAEELASDVEAMSVNGRVEVSSSGQVEASSVNGSVEASMGRADWSGTLKLSTVNGGLTVTLPASAAARVHAETVNGDMQSDFPLTIRGRWGPRQMDGTIGDGGGRTLDLSTVNGGIAIRRAR